MMAGYDMLIVTFNDPVKVLGSMFSDAPTWGVDFLKGWIEGYESIRMIPIDGHAVVITSEHNVSYVKEWFMRYMAITGMREF